MDVQERNTSESYRLLIEKHNEKLVLFAIQNGYSIEMSHRLVEKSFIQFIKSEEQIENHSVWMLYHYVVKAITSSRPDDQLSEQLFSFEEDNELHQMIITLRPETKLPFIFSKFHDLSHDEISRIVEMSSDEINNAIEEVHRMLRGRMDPAIIDKRLGFLRKSYERIKIQFEIENVLQQPQVAEVEKPKNKLNISKKTLFYWIAGFAAIFTLSTVSIVNSEGFQQAAAEKYVHGLEESFEQTLSTKLIEIGIGEVTNEEQVAYRFGFIYNARESFNELINKLEQQLANNQPMSKKEIEREYNEVLLKLQTPSDMAQSLFDNPLVNNIEQSKEFMNHFFEQYYAVRELYYMSLDKHHHHFQKEFVKQQGAINNQFNIEEFIAKNDNLPEDFMLLVDGIKKQNFHLISIHHWASVYPRFHRNDFSEKIRTSLHEDVGGYLTFIENEPFTLYPDLAYSLEETIEFIKEFEESLLTAKPNHTFSYYLRNTYTELLYEVTAGSMPGKIYNQLGIVRNEYQEAWKKIASFGDHSPSAIVVRQVVSEMEDRNWKRAMIQNGLDRNLFHRALDLAISGNLNDFVWEENNEFGRNIAFLSDTEFLLSVTELYNKFSINHDLSILEHTSPLEIFAVYDYANELKDPETMWHLLDHDHIPYSMEEFVEMWQPRTPIHEQADFLYAENYGEVIDNSRLIQIGYQKDHNIKFYARMIENTDTSTWLFYEIPHD